MSNFWESDPVAQSASGQFWDKDPIAPPVTANKLARSAASGVPVIGGVLNKLDAATNAALAPVLNPLFDDKDQLKEPTFSGRYAHSLADQEKMDKDFQEQHPIVDAAAKVAGGVGAGSALLKAAPVVGGRILGLGGETLPGQAIRGAASGAGIGAADAAVRGEDPIHAAEIGGGIGAVAPVVARGVGAIVDSLRNVKQPAAIPANTVDVAGVPVRQSMGQLTGDADTQMLEQGALRNTAGQREQQTAQDFFDAQKGELSNARQAIASKMSPTGEVHAENPQDAAAVLLDSLGKKGQATQAAEAAKVAQVGQEGAALAGGLGPLQRPTATSAAETISDRLAAARDAAKADYRGKYNHVAAQEGEFAPGSAAGFRNDIESGLANADHPVSLDATNTPKALQALRVIDDRMNAVGPGRLGASADLGPQHAKTVADIRARFGDDIASTYDRQQTAAAAATPAAPKAQSLLEFLASKGGLGPDSELEAIGAHGHTVNVEGAGRRKLVKQGGLPLDYAREAAEEAGYLRGENGSTSTPREFLDAIDAELRGQKRYPAGFEGHVGKREAAAMSERERAELDRHMQGFEDDLNAAGHGEIAPDVKQRAVHLMANERMGADEAVDHAIAQLEQEEAAGAHGFPGDRPAPSPSAAPETLGSGFTMRDVEQVRKQLSTLYGDARRAMMAGGSGSDLYALEHIMDRFDSRVGQMVKEGKFSGDGPAVLKMQQEARASFSDYKQKFSKRGSGDTTGAAVEKILGKFSDTKATPDSIVNLAYGSSANPGGQLPVQIAQRISNIFGRDSQEFGAYKQGLVAHLMQGEPEKAASRIEEFLSGTKGKLLSQTVFDATERAKLAQYAARLRTTIPKTDLNQTDKIMARLTGADGNAPPTTSDVVQYLNTTKGVSRPVQLVQRLKSEFGEGSKEVSALKQGQWSFLTENKTGALDVGSKQTASRIKDFLDGDGKPLSHAMYSPQERDLIRAYGDLMQRITPISGTVNYSNTAATLGKMMRGSIDGIFAGAGFHLAGPLGLAAGKAANSAQNAIGDVVKASKVARSLYGTPNQVVADRNLMQAIQRMTTITARAAPQAA